MLGLIAFGIFLTVMLTLHACYSLYHVLATKKAAQRRIAERLGNWGDANQKLSGLLVRSDSLSEIGWIDVLLKETQWVKKHFKIDRLQRLHRQSGATRPLAGYLLAALTLAMAGSVAGIKFRLGAPMSVILALVCGSTPILLLYRMRAKRILSFQQMMPDALELISRALKAGHAFFLGVKIAGDELSDPIGGELRRVYDDISMGLAAPEALERLLDRVDCPDVKYFVAAVSVQRETGGNLAEIMESLAMIIRKRFEFQAKVKALSAEGVLSAAIVFIMPFVMATFQYMLNPEYMSLLWTDPAGKMMITVAAVMMIVGAVVTRRLIDLKV
jgi:tight adherence protein B